MSNTPTNAEAWDLWLESITGGHHPASLAKFARAVLAKWAAPQPAPAPLSDAQIAEMMRDTWGCASIAPRHALIFARTVERAHGITQKGGS